MQSVTRKSIFVNARFLTQPITGVQRFAIEICLHLKQLLPQLQFVAPKNVLHDEVARKLDVQKCGSRTGHLWEQMDLPLYLASKGSPLLLNLCNTAPLFYSKKIVCIHDLAFLINPTWFKRSFSLFYSFLVPRVARQAQRVITVSEHSQNAIVDLLNIDKYKVEVVYNAVCDNFALQTIVHPNKYGNYILAVGSLDPRKNLKRLVKAFNSLQDKSLNLVIVGAPSKIFGDTELRKLIEGDKRVILTGYLSDEALANAYQNALMFVYPSLYEGFGIPPLEAMHCGCATIVSNTTSLPEVCADASYYVNPESEEEIAQAITLLWQNKALKEELVERGYVRSRFFSWRKSALKLAGIVEYEAKQC